MDTNRPLGKALEEVRTVESRFETANQASDTTALESIFAEDFSFTGGTGAALDRAGWMSGMLARRQTPAGQAQDTATLERAKLQSRGTVMLLTGLRVGECEDSEIELHDDVAIVNRLYSIQDADGSERHLRYTRVYRRLDGDWKLISHRYIHAVD